MKSVETPRKPETSREGGKGGRPTPPERTPEVRVIDIVVGQIDRISDLVNELRIARDIQRRLDPLINRDFEKTINEAIDKLLNVKDGLEYIVGIYTNLSRSAKDALG